MAKGYDDEFDVLLYDLSNGEINSDPDRLSTLVFNPFLPRFNKTLMLQNDLENKSCYLMGDFNLNLLNYQSHNPTIEFLDVMYSNMFFPLITHPARITYRTAMLINNIFTNHIDHHLFAGLLFTDISDHLPVFCINYHDSVKEVKNKYSGLFRNIPFFRWLCNVIKTKKHCRCW